ncbi:MAG: PTS sugar transporter subunit IIA [Lachnospiraceae bacterium]|nr:PTS sugar transporter subunit IIA [Lachnospiraceae bacterium]
MGQKNHYLAIEGEASNWEEAIRLCGEAIENAGYADGSFMDACIDREKEYPTGLPTEIPVAIPHSKVESIKENCVCLLRLKEPVEFRRMDDDEKRIQTRIIFNLAIKGGDTHLEFLQTLMSSIMDKEMIEQCMKKEIREIPEYLEKKLN